MRGASSPRTERDETLAARGQDGVCDGTAPAVVRPVREVVLCRVLELPSDGPRRHGRELHREARAHGRGVRGLVAGALGRGGFLCAALRGLGDGLDLGRSGSRGRPAAATLLARARPPTACRSPPGAAPPPPPRMAVVIAVGIVVAEQADGPHVRGSIKGWWCCAGVSFSRDGSRGLMSPLCRVVKWHMPPVMRINARLPSCSCNLDRARICPARRLCTERLRRCPRRPHRQRAERATRSGTTRSCVKSGRGGGSSIKGQGVTPLPANKTVALRKRWGCEGGAQSSPSLVDLIVAGTLGDFAFQAPRAPKSVVCVARRVVVDDKEFTG